MGGGEQKNLLIATFLSIAVILVWQLVFIDPEEMGRQQAEQQRIEAAQQDAAAPSAPNAQIGAAPSLGAAPAEARNEALERTDRVKVETPNLSGSISLKGGRIDDISLNAYRETLDPDSANVTLLSPTGSEGAYYAVYGWLTASGASVPNPTTEWSVERGDVLTPDSPVTLIWDNGEGLIFRRVISVDDMFMFSVKQSVENTTGAEIALAPYGIIARHGEPETSPLFVLHEGGVARFDEELSEIGYSDLRDLDQLAAEGGAAEAFTVAENGWLGFTDKYWMTVMAAAPGQGFTGVYKNVQAPGGEIFQADMRLPLMAVPAGGTAEIDTHLFAGAKDYDAIKAYETKLGIVRFIDSIDWGWFFFLTKPMFQLLHFLYGAIGNMGWAILALTVLVKTALFPLAYKSFVSMSKMKKLQPEMEKIKERAGEDKQKLQQEMMGLYKKEKVNPASGCVPILLQIPIFFSLYKVISVTLELRHAPFILWIDDLSAPDPTSILNLFGLLPFDTPAPDSMFALVSIGVFPILMGITMWMQQKLNPAPTDPMQAKIFGWMPWIFMFMLGNFASGLVIYWVANNVLTFTQQFLIMRSQGVEVDFFGNVKQSFRRKKAPAKPEAAVAQPANDNPGGKKSARRNRKKK